MRSGHVPTTRARTQAWPGSGWHSPTHAGAGGRHAASTAVASTRVERLTRANVAARCVGRRAGAWNRLAVRCNAFARRGAPGATEWRAGRRRRCTAAVGLAGGYADYGDEGGVPDATGVTLTRVGSANALATATSSMTTRRRSDVRRAANGTGYRECYGNPPSACARVGLRQDGVEAVLAIGRFGIACA
jgi:hypothetical protein